MDVSEVSWHSPICTTADGKTYILRQAELRDGYSMICDVIGGKDLTAMAGRSLSWKGLSPSWRRSDKLPLVPFLFQANVVCGQMRRAPMERAE